MAKPRYLKLQVEEADRLIECLRDALGKAGLDNQKRRELGLGLQGLLESRRQRNGRAVVLDEARATRLLRCLIAISDWTESLWQRCLGDEWN